MLSLKAAVGDAEARVGECLEGLREERGLRSAAQTQLAFDLQCRHSWLMSCPPEPCPAHSDCLHTQPGCPGVMGCCGVPPNRHVPRLPESRPALQAKGRVG